MVWYYSTLDTWYSSHLHLCMVLLHPVLQYCFILYSSTTLFSTTAVALYALLQSTSSSPTAPHVPLCPAVLVPVVEGLEGPGVNGKVWHLVHNTAGAACSYIQCFQEWMIFFICLFNCEGLTKSTFLDDFLGLHTWTFDYLPKLLPFITFLLRVHVFHKWPFL